MNPEKILPKNPKMGIMPYYGIYYMQGRPPKENEIRLNRDNHRVIWLLPVYIPFPNSLHKWRRSTAIMNRFVKNGTVSKVWLTEITGPPPEVIPNILVGRNLPNFRNLCTGMMANIRGFHVSMHCSMASEVIYLYQSSILLNYQN